MARRCMVDYDIRHQPEALPDLADILPISEIWAHNIIVANREAII